jgi:hypothetical protein
MANLFRKEPFEIEFIAERFKAAFDYFYKTLDGLVYSTLKKIEEIKKTRKAHKYALKN